MEHLTIRISELLGFPNYFLSDRRLYTINCIRYEILQFGNISIFLLKTLDFSGFPVYIMYSSTGNRPKKERKRKMKNETTNNNATVLALLNVPTLDSMPEIVKTAAAAEKSAAENVKTAAAAAEQAQKDIAAAIAAGDIAAAQKALKAQGKTAAELEKAKAAHRTAAAELEKVKEAHPYKAPAAAEYCIVAAAELLKAGKELTAKTVATAAIALMPENSRPSTPNGTEMTARGVIAVLNCIKKESAK
jgi:hypothetical protein